MRSSLAFLAPVAAVALLAGCGEGEPVADPAPSTHSASPWNPCDGLDAGPISAALGATVRVEDGGGDVYRCAVLPEAEGDARMSITYQWSGVTLEEAWKQMGIPAGRATSPRIAGADAARLVVDAGPKAVAVTGFVQTGDLIQVVNALDLPPHDRGAVVGAVEVVLEQLVAAAPESP